MTFSTGLGQGFIAHHRVILLFKGDELIWFRLMALLTFNFFVFGAQNKGRLLIVNKTRGLPTIFIMAIGAVGAELATMVIIMTGRAILLRNLRELKFALRMGRICRKHICRRLMASGAEHLAVFALQGKSRRAVIKGQTLGEILRGVTFRAVLP